MPENLNTRNTSLGVGGFLLSLPIFFPSISSIKTDLPITEYLKVFIALNFSTFLVSAHDIFNCKRKELLEVQKLLALAKSKGIIILLDSGNFESYWKSDKKWKDEQYLATLQSTPHTIAFVFDTQLNTVASIEKRVLRSQKLSTGSIIPIVHSRDKEKRVKLISEVVKKLNPLFIAIPERELGDGIIARAREVFRIKSVLNREKKDCLLHLLGTGNPLSILLYSICGADMFDGLEWSQAAVDYGTGVLYHFHEREILGDQCPNGAIRQMPYQQATLVHNLYFYLKFMLEIGKTIEENRTSEMLKAYFPRSFLDKLIKEIPDIFENGC